MVFIKGDIVEMTEEARKMFPKRQSFRGTVTATTRQAKTVQVDRTSWSQAFWRRVETEAAVIQYNRTDAE